MYLKDFSGLNSGEYKWKYQHAKSITSLSILKGSVDKNQNS